MSEPAETVIELKQADIPRSEALTSGSVVRNVDWSVRRGSFWALGGFAGAGKTDLLLTAAALQRPSRGELVLFGKRMAELHEDEFVSIRLKVGMVFATGRLFSHLTVAENILLPLQYHARHLQDTPNEIVEKVLDQTGLTNRAHQLPREIPRALHQRVALARAMALSPEVLLVDSPLIGVDQRNIRWWIDFLCAAHLGDPRIGRPMTIVVGTDDLRPWLDTAKDFAVLNDQRFLAVGGRDEVRAASEPTLRDLLTGAFDDQ